MARVAPAVTRRLRSVALEAWLPIGLFVTWWVASANSKSLYFPSLKSIIGAFRSDWLGSGITANVLPSLSNIARGYALAVVFAVLGGLVLGLVRPIGEALSPVVDFLRSVPGVALVPLGLVLLGIGNQTKIVLIAYGAFWPILLTTIDGVRGIDATQIDVVKSYRLPLFVRLTQVVLPAASPQIVAGMRTSVSIAITVSVFTEMVGSTQGIGYSLLASQRDFAIPNMWAGILLLGIIGYVLNSVFGNLEQILLRRHHAASGQVGGHRA